ncbi:uncharacterized protein [Rutidosis leptorrhynchoides]|uniref:uncharacterized protein n=1 Tax=Rutidosis leptorrhynchoides TaxID=125765 RepID=UPI003A99F9CE
MSHDDWLTAAMSDSDIVAKLLVTLRSPSPPPPPPPPHRPPHTWTIHQRRSPTQTLIQPPDKSEPPRASPSTPLSWSGPTSDAAVESSQQLHHNQSHTSGSKVTPPGDNTPSKRPRKKKTLAALKEEEMLLITEQNDLKRKLAALQSTFENQRNRNQNLKKMKLDVQVELQSEITRAYKNSQFEAVDVRNEGFVLPDLNVPFKEDVIMSY